MSEHISQELIDCLRSADSNMRLMVQLGTLLKGNNMAVCEEAAEVYKLAIKCRWTEAIPMVEKDISMCIEWLESGRNEVRSKMAFILLETLCSEGISIVSNYILRILTLISPYLHNSKIEMRMAAARTLYACLKLFPRQDELSRSMLLSYIAEELIKDQNLGTIEGHHASLLRCQGLIQYGDRFMQSYFGKASELALKLRSHNSPIVSRAAISLLPILAKYSPKNFAQYVIQRRNTSSDNDETLLECVSKYLVDLARNNSQERAVAFVALADIAKSCRNDFYPYLEMTTNVIRDVLSQNSRPRNAKPDTEENIAAVLQTIAALASAMGSVLIDYMHDILDLMFTTGLSQSLFSSLAELGDNITELQMAIQDRILDFVSVILVDVPFRSVQHSLNSLESHMGAIDDPNYFTSVSTVNSNNFMSRLVLVLVRLLQSTKSSRLQTSVVDLVCVLMEQLQDDFTMFIPTINMALKRAGIKNHTKYEQYSKYLFSGRPIPADTQQSQLIIPGNSTISNKYQQTYSSTDGAQLEFDISHLRNAWTTQHILSDDNWNEWLAKFTIELLNQSPSPALRACASLALSNPGLSLAGFMERDEKQIPIDLKHLAEYASRCHSLAKELHYKEAEWILDNNYDVIEKLIDLNQNMDLHDSAIGMLNYVKKERPDIKESVEWYTRLRHWDDALTIYRREEAEFGYSYENINGQIQCLYEMSDWETLVPIYQRIWQDGDHQLRTASANVGVNIAWAMGEFDRMQAYLSILPEDNHNKPFYQAILAVHNNQFDAATSYIYNARMGIREELISHIGESYDRAYSQVFQCQMLTELEEIMAYKLAEGDKMLQMSIVNSWQQRLDGIQQDVDMWQKILRMRKMVLRPIRDLDMWIKYINMCRKSGRINTATRAIRNLLEDEADYMDGIIRYKITDVSYSDMLQAEEYTRLQRLQQQNRYAAKSERVKDGLSLNYSSMSGSSSPVYDIFDSETLDNMIRLTQKPPQGAFEMLEMFTKKYSEKIGFDIQNPDAFADHVYACELESNNSNADYDYSEAARTHRLLSRFYSRQAEWLVDIEQNGMLEEEAKNKATLGGAGVGANTGDQKASKAAKDMDLLYRLKSENISERILESNRAATVLDHMSYKAWHNLAVRHYTESQKYDTENISTSKDIVEKHAVPAVHGFIRAIQLSMGHTSLQDMLRLLTVWFNYAQYDQVVQAVQSQLKSISLRMWMQVIPQILARTHIQHQKTIDLIKHILTDIGKFHPNAIMFSLYVAARSEHPDRIKISKEILASLHELTPELVEETEVVSRELIRVTLLFPEMWHDAIDYTSKLYYNFDNADEMLRILPPLYDRLRNPETLREIHFAQLFGNILMTAEQYLRKYFSVDKEHRDESYMHQAWKYFTKVFYECGKMIQDFQHIMLDNTAPLLLECRNMHLAVPGTYDPDREVVHIDSFDPVVRVYDSKQHPRSMNICGSDGNKYTFVLKGHEDLRQDERVMQLFGLINSFLAIDDKTSQRSLAIERYPVIPLSSNVGLIGFYPNCDSITDVIRYFRESHQRSVHEENQMLHDISTDWKSLSGIERIESFEYVIERTACDDLQQAMWFNSPNAETWLERRTNYTRSLAVMSIVGYILGLGDRHLTNILLHSTNGKVVHIDLGDCFELAAQRDEYPETVPFRLTRMVTMPMEVSNIEGAFKYTAHHTMRVLRSHRDSVMAVLEAFVFDPLVSWLYTQEKEDAPPATSIAPNKHNVSNVIESQIFNLGAGSKPNAESDGGRVIPGSRPDNQYSRSYRVRSGSINEKGWQMGNPKAQLIFKRIHDKLVGTDFDPNVQLSVADQVKKLVQQATSSDNLAVMYAGWMPIW
ncbi:phosphatidylinositol kinase- protein kinase tor1 [Coemansia interrupta]|uniref:non-specific serine/threonine protein kinase n=1 Tax=Coemansia interrupta TaxID=1126814 RepID=A0A9W8LHS5_9FUNG|nr:phosphatidylinositol kinase- protein kinase tor1 [Coemansia interrupta]